MFFFFADQQTELTKIKMSWMQHLTEIFQNLTKYNLMFLLIFCIFEMTNRSILLHCLTICSQIIADDRDDKWIEINIDTNKIHQIFNSNYIKSKKKFLHCLTKFAVNKKMKKLFFASSWKKSKIMWLFE